MEDRSKNAWPMSELLRAMREQQEMDLARDVLQPPSEKTMLDLATLEALRAVKH